LLKERFEAPLKVTLLSSASHLTGCKTGVGFAFLVSCFTYGKVGFAVAVWAAIKDMDFQYGYLLSWLEAKKPTSIEVGWNKMHRKFAGGKLRGNLPPTPLVPKRCPLGSSELGENFQV